MTDTLEPTAVIPPGEEPVSEEEAQAVAIASQTTLAEDEEVIAKGLGTFIEVGSALTSIRVGQKYRDTHGTFEEYLRERWDLSGPYAYQTMDAAKTVKALPAGAPRPQNEGQARALHDVPEVWRAEVMVEAHEATNGHLTARAIKKAFNVIAVRAAGDITLKPVVQYVVDELHTVYPGGRQIKSMAKKYKHPVPEELNRIRAAEEIRADDDHRLTPEEWLLRRAILELDSEVLDEGPHKNSTQLNVPVYFGRNWKPAPSDAVGLTAEIKRSNRKSNPSGLKWRGEVISPSKAAEERKKKAAAKETAPPSEQLAPSTSPEPNKSKDEEPPPPTTHGDTNAEEEYEDDETEGTPPAVPQSMGADTVIAADVISYLLDCEIYFEGLIGDWDFTDSSVEQVTSSVEDLRVALDTLRELATRRAKEQAATQSAELIPGRSTSPPPAPEAGCRTGTVVTPLGGSWT